MVDESSILKMRSVWSNYCLCTTGLYYCFIFPFFSIFFVFVAASSSSLLFPHPHYCFLLFIAATSSSLLLQLRPPSCFVLLKNRKFNYSLISLCSLSVLSLSLYSLSLSLSLSHTRAPSLSALSHLISVPLFLIECLPLVNSYRVVGLL